MTEPEPFAPGDRVVVDGVAAATVRAVNDAIDDPVSDRVYVRMAEDGHSYWIARDRLERVR